MSQTIKIDFKPFGEIMNTKDEFEELEQKYEEHIRKLTEPEEKTADLQFGKIIYSSLPLENIQTHVKEVLHNTKQYYNELLVEEATQNKEEELKNGFSRVPYRKEAIQDLHIDEKNPFHWQVNVLHEPPKKYQGIPDHLYETFLKDNSLYLKLLVVIYRNKNVNPSDPITKPYFIYVSRSKGRSHVYYDFLNSLEAKLKSQEK